MGCSVPIDLRNFARPPHRSRAWQGNSSLQGFDIPIATLVDESFNQPIFGANNLSGTSPPLDGTGLAQLVGVATIAPSGDPWLDRFLGLPDEALALLRCRFGPLVPAGRDLP